MTSVLEDPGGQGDWSRVSVEQVSERPGEGHRDQDYRKALASYSEWEGKPSVGFSGGVA